MSMWTDSVVAGIEDYYKDVEARREFARKLMVDATAVNQGLLDPMDVGIEMAMFADELWEYVYFLYPHDLVELLTSVAEKVLWRIEHGDS